MCSVFYSIMVFSTLLYSNLSNFSLLNLLLFYDKGYNVHRMFREAEAFFTSLGLPAMTQEFWNRSLFEKPKDEQRKVECSPSSHNFYNKRDFRYDSIFSLEATLNDLMEVYQCWLHRLRRDLLTGSRSLTTYPNICGMYCTDFHSHNSSLIWSRLWCGTADLWSSSDKVAIEKVRLSCSYPKSITTSK